MSHYYNLCCQHKGKVVTIYEKCGKMHVGKIVHVDHQHVYLEPMTPGVSGYGWGFGGWGWGYRPWFPIALAAIGGFALGSAFFWI